MEPTFNSLVLRGTGYGTPNVPTWTSLMCNNSEYISGMNFTPVLLNAVEPGRVYALSPNRATELYVCTYCGSDSPAPSHFDVSLVQYQGPNFINAKVSFGTVNTVYLVGSLDADGNIVYY